MTSELKVVTIAKIANRKNRTFTLFLSFKFLIVDSPAFPPAKPQCESLGESNLETFGKGPQKLFSLLIYDKTI
jgi:hypothetical protein